MSTPPSQTASSSSVKKSSSSGPTSLLLLEMCPCGLSVAVGGSPSGEEATFALIGTPTGLWSYQATTRRISFGIGLSELQPCETCGGLLLFSKAEMYARLSGTLLSVPPSAKQ